LDAHLITAVADAFCGFRKYFSQTTIDFSETSRVESEHVRGSSLNDWGERYAVDSASF
jgi:hypothetical protein